MLGLDEAGCGPAFGDLVASAVYIPETVTSLKGITDSKKLSEKKRNIFFETICSKCFFGIGKVTNHEIDTNGLAEARRAVFERALDNFQEKYPTFEIKKLVIDGTIFRQWKNIEHECVVGGDSKYEAVSAASIIAKVTRDNDIYNLCKENPYLDEFYDISKNKGYLSSKKHKEGIKKHGLSVFHRHSYKISLN